MARDCRDRRILGDDVELEIHAFDETNSRIRPEKLARLIEKAGNGMVMMVGVQSNQFPRALDLAKPLLAHGVDLALTPVTDEEIDSLEMFHTRSADVAVDRERRHRAREAAAA